MTSDKMGKVAAAVAVINGKAYDGSKPPAIRKEELDSALEAVLVRSRGLDRHHINADYDLDQT